MFQLFRAKKSRAGSDLAGLKSRHEIGRPAAVEPRLQATPATPSPPPAPSADVASPFTGPEVRRAQQYAMRLRQSYGALSAKAECERRLKAASTPAETRFLQLVLRSIGGA